MTRYKQGLAFRYIQNTKYFRDRPGTDNLGSIPSTTPFKNYPEAEPIQLPEPDLSRPANFWQCLATRRSKRNTTPDPLSLQELSKIMWAAQGVTHGGVAGDALHDHRPAVRRAPEQQGLHAAVLVAERDLQGEDPLAVALEPEVARLDDAGVDRVSHPRRTAGARARRHHHRLPAEARAGAGALAHPCKIQNLHSSSSITCFSPTRK